MDLDAQLLSVLPTVFPKVELLESASESGGAKASGISPQDLKVLFEMSQTWK